MPAGRPTKYKSEYNEQVTKLCYLGADDNDIARFFEVDKATINRWKNQHPEFCASIKEGKENADAEIAKALYHKAKGYEIKEDVEKEIDGELQTVTLSKKMPPDTTACIFWLKNRRRQDWTDRKEVKLDAEITDVTEYSDTERFARMALYLGLSPDQEDGRVSEEGNEDMGASTGTAGSSTKH